MNRSLLLAAGSLLLPAVLHAGESWDETASMPLYAPQAPVQGTLRLWGHGSPTTDFMGRLVRAWEADFANYQPGIRFEHRMYGTASAVGALYTGAGDLALMGEEIFPFEADAYRRATGREIGSLEIATGSLDVRNFDFAQMLFVHEGNPITRLSLGQIRALYTAESGAGVQRFHTWGDLGLTGDWAERPIHLYGWSYDNDFWNFLRDAIFKGSHRQSGELRGYAHLHRPDGTIYDAGQQMLDDLAKDPNGIAISNGRYRRAGVKPLAIGASESGPFYEASKATLVSRRYPLTRILPAAFNQVPGHPLDPALHEFLRYLLSRQGQAVVVRDDEYLPLSASAVAAERAKLDAPLAPLVRVCGDTAMRPLIEHWEAAYRRLHPRVVFETNLQGSGTALAGLYCSTADIAFLGRSVDPVESMAFAWVLGRRPVGIEVATGNLSRDGFSPALAVYTSKDNPASSITFEQLDAVFGAGHRRSPVPAKSWGDLGLTGDWATRPVHAFIYDTGTHTAGFFRDTVLMGSFAWNWDNVTDMPGEPASADVALTAALSKDPYALAVADMGSLGDCMKPLAIISPDSGRPVLPSATTLADRTYPLARSVYAYIDHAKGAPLPDDVRGFLEYILSAEGQAGIAAQDDFIALPAASATAQRDRL